MNILFRFVFAGALALLPLSLTMAQTAAGPSENEVEAAQWIVTPAAIDFLKTFEFGKGDEDYVKFRKGARLLDTSARKKLEDEIVKAGTAGQLSKGGRWIAVRTLAWMGSEASVPLLVQWAKDGDGFDAVYALAGLNIPAADTALAGLFPAAQDRLKASILNALAGDRDPALVKQVAPVLSSKEAGIAAFAYLSAIASDEAIAVLTAAKPEGSLQAAQEWALIDAAHHAIKANRVPAGLAVFQGLLKTSQATPAKVAAAQGLLAAEGSKAFAGTLFGLLKSPDDKLRMGLAGALVANDKLKPMPELVPALAQSFREFPEDVQVVILSNIQRHGRKEFLPVVEAAMQASSVPVQLLAIADLGLVGNSSALDMLAASLSDSAKREAAIAALGRLSGSDVTAKILQRAGTADAPLKPAWLSIISLRADHSAMSFVVESAKSAQADVRSAAFAALGNVAQPEDLGLVIDLRASASGNDDVKAWREALVRLSKARAGDAQAVALLKPLTEKGDKEDLPYVATALAYLKLPEASSVIKVMLTSPDLEQRKAVIRSLSSVRNSESARLLEDAAANGQDPAEKILAVKGLLDSVKPLNLGGNEQVALYERIWNLATRPEEKDAVISALKNMKNKEADALIAKLTPATT